MDPKASPRNKAIVAALILLAVVVRLAGLSWGLPYVYHVDEARFAQLSAGIVKGDLNPHFFFIPNLYMYMVAGAWEGAFLAGKVLGTFHTRADFLGRLDTDPTLLYLLGRLVTVLTALLTVFFLYVLGKRMYNPRVGWLAALFLILSLEHTRASHDMYPDATMLLFMVLSFLFIWAVYREGKTRDYLLAGLFAGLAFATKYGGHVLFISLALAHLFRGLEQKRPLREIILSLPLVGSGLAFVLAFLAVDPYVLFDFATFKAHFNWQSAHLFSLGHYGTAPSVSVPLFYLRYGFLENLGLVIQFLALGGLILGFVKSRRREWILFATPLVLQITVSTWKTYATRYMLPSAPFFILIAAFFTDWLLSRPRPGGAPGAALKEGWASGRRAWMGAALVTLAVLPSAVRIFKFDVNLIRPDTRTVAKDWIEANLPPGTKIALEQYGPPISPSVYHAFSVRPSLSQVNLEWLSRRRIEYAVISDLEYSRFVPYPKDFPSQAAFYRSLDEKAILIKTFLPKWDDKLVDLHNPTIKIYRLSTCPDPGFPGNFRKYAQSVTLVRTSETAWTLRSAIKAAGLVPRDERVFRPYVRLVDAKEREAALLVLKDGPFGKSGGGALSLLKAAPLGLAPGRYTIRVGYLFVFTSKVPGLDPSRRLAKETPLAEVQLDSGKPGKKIEYLFSYAAFPNTRGDDYVQAVTLARTGSGWRLTGSIYGGELRFGDDYVVNPFVAVVDGAGRTTDRFVLFDGKVGSFHIEHPGGVRRTFKLPVPTGKRSLVAGYDSYYDDQRPGRSGGPAEVPLLLPPGFSLGSAAKNKTARPPRGETGGR
jgi:hypothetical protein